MADEDKNPNQMVVEDTDLKGVVANLARHRIANWPAAGSENLPIWIRQKNSAAETLEPSFLKSMFQMPGLKALGVVVDADDALLARWQAVRSFATRYFSSVPTRCPEAGLVLDGDGPRFGAWIMPDNRSAGMLEDFCRALVPVADERLWLHATSATADARSHGGDYKDVHRTKANVHTWLAWRDPPGERMGIAIAKKLLDPHAVTANAFVSWLAKLYQLEETGAVGP